MKTIHYTELGATLFIPAVHPKLFSIVQGEKYPTLQAVVIDTEDGIAKESFADALNSIQDLLLQLDTPKPLVFLRPRNAEVLESFLSLAFIQKVDGFVLPKFSLNNAQSYLSLLEDREFVWMPSIEGEEIFEEEKLLALRTLFLEHKKSIPLIRFGLEDILRQLSLRRRCEDSVFDLATGNFLLGRFITLFKSVGFCVSGGVFPCYKDDIGFIKDVQRDLKEGLFSKTMIHPQQILLLQDLYKVAKRDFDEALEILLQEEAVFAQNGKMAEKVTMSPYSEEIIMRAQIYGLK